MNELPKERKTYVKRSCGQRAVCGVGRRAEKLKVSEGTWSWRVKQGQIPSTMESH